MDTQNCEIFDQLLYVRSEVLSASRAGQDIRSSQIHQTVLTEGVSTLQDTWYFILIIVGIEADGAGYVHFRCAFKF